MSSSSRRAPAPKRYYRKPPQTTIKAQIPLTDEHFKVLCHDADGTFTDDDSIRSDRKTEATSSATSLASIAADHSNTTNDGREFVVTSLKRRNHYSAEELYDLYKFAEKWDLDELRQICKTRLINMKSTEALDVAMKLELHDVKTAILISLKKRHLVPYLAAKLSFTIADMDIIGNTLSSRHPGPQHLRSKGPLKNDATLETNAMTKSH